MLEGEANFTRLGFGLRRFFSPKENSAFLLGEVGFGWANSGKPQTTTYQSYNSLTYQEGYYPNYSSSYTRYDDKHAGFALAAGVGYQLWRTSSIHSEVGISLSTLIAPRRVLSTLGLRIGIYFPPF